MAQYISKSVVVAEIEKLIDEIYAGRPFDSLSSEQQTALWYVKSIMSSIDTLEVIDPYEQCIQYASIESGIKAHAEDYSFNIESELFNQLTKEQQALWRNEIEQAVISGGYSGLNLAKDPRYKENLEVKEVDLEKEIDTQWNKFVDSEGEVEQFSEIAKHFFELGLQSTLTEEDMRLVWTIGDEIPYMPEEDFFKELLKRFKAQKGE